MSVNTAALTIGRLGNSTNLAHTVDDALEQIDRHLDAASLSGLPWVRIVHGKGTGRLRRAVREFLTDHPLVSSHEPGARNEGGEGVTVAKLARG